MRTIHALCRFIFSLFGVGVRVQGRIRSAQQADRDSGLVVEGLHDHISVAQAVGAGVI